MTPDGADDQNAPKAEREKTESSDKPEKDEKKDTTQIYRYKGPSAENAVKAVKNTTVVKGSMSFLADALIRIHSI